MLLLPASLTSLVVFVVVIIISTVDVVIVEPWVFVLHEINANKMFENGCWLHYSYGIDAIRVCHSICKRFIATRRTVTHFSVAFTCEFNLNFIELYVRVSNVACVWRWRLENSGNESPSIHGQLTLNWMRWGRVLCDIEYIELPSTFRIWNLFLAVPLSLLSLFFFSHLNLTLDKFIALKSTAVD